MRRKLVAAGLVVAVAVAGAGVALAITAGARGSDAAPEVVATAPGAETPQAVAASDFCFVESMIFYRVEAVELATVLRGMDDVSPPLRAFADTVVEDDSAELDELRERYVAWADARPLEPTDDGACAGHGAHAQMPGMPSLAQRGDLSAADGAAGEQLFLALMIAQNAGVAALVADTLDVPAHPIVRESAERALAAGAIRARGLAELRDAAP
ncbi:DUF305 domain-containing protein [Microbacterium sp. 2FI]|uniref:DUF305 domain-containing protein n=1 Tax=Microbacterium sp. 2FI TaxID=2502193 RepID=UPI0010F57C7B|nr:DUF305 domain-containing protein [Microbacterium sp. 2FI]